MILIKLADGAVMLTGILLGLLLAAALLAMAALQVAWVGRAAQRDRRQ